MTRQRARGSKRKHQNVAKEITKHAKVVDYNEDDDDNGNDDDGDDEV